MTDRAGVLADEIRHIVEALSTRRHRRQTTSTRRSALARRMVARLEGPPRLRWCETVPLDVADQTGLSGSAYQEQSPLRGAHNPVAPPLVVEEVVEPDGSQVLLGRARLGPAYEGPPHGVHGGWVAACSTTSSAPPCASSTTWG